MLFLSEFGCASFAHAQDDSLNVSPMPEMETIGDARLRAYVAALPSAPVPKVEAVAGAIVASQSRIQNSTERRHSIFWLDRTSFTYGLVQGGAEIFDGFTTRNFVHHCSHCFENDPMSRLLLGAHPSWGGMIPMGMAEAVASAYSYKRLSHSPHRFLRAAAPLVPIGLTAMHVIEGARNIPLKNKYRCADPGYIVVGAACIPAPPPVLIGASGPGGAGSGSRRDPI
ncbi:MAG TPA: hypothetical protein VGJ06_10370 [Candidatus Acidoferrum sp.]|jgi:hypothetical protein